MSNLSAHLSLPYIQANQAQKHVTHNEAIRLLDSLTQLAVINATTTAAPTSPTPGDRYIVASPATGDWQGQENTLAIWDENTWRFLTPNAGWTTWDMTNLSHLVWDGSTWAETGGSADLDNIDMLGINTTADAQNRLALAADASLFTHDGADHQLKINKASTPDTASLLFQSNWTGHAEFGLVGNNDFVLKTSPNGTTFNTSLEVDRNTGSVSFPSGVSGIANPEFGDSSLITVDYAIAKGVDLVTNSTGILGNNYNYPDDFTFDPSTSPNLPASFYHKGYYPGMKRMEELIPVDPNKAYRLGCYLRQESVPGDWSAYANEERHRQEMGFVCFDIDGNKISPTHYFRFHSGGQDSLTTLAAPLSPGDTTISLVNAAGWNDSVATALRRSPLIFGYQNSYGAKYDFYSRLSKAGLFDLSGVDKTNNIITLNQPLPASLGNPDDPSGTWPVGTSIANADYSGSQNYAFYSTLILPQTDTWYKIENYCGGINKSGKLAHDSFPPGTAFVQVFWFPNYLNRAGGYSVYPDTGPDQKIWVTGVSITPEPMVAIDTDAGGTVSLKAPKADFAAGTLSLEPTALSVSEL